ncbi:MAG: hypothetical protein QM706_13985 [Nitrospira sp.]
MKALVDASSVHSIQQEHERMRRYVFVIFVMINSFFSNDLTRAHDPDEPIVLEIAGSGGESRSPGRSLFPTVYS